MTLQEQLELCGPCVQFFAVSPKPTIVVSGPEHNVRYINPAFTRLTGIDGARILGHSILNAMRDVDGVNYHDFLNEVLRSGSELLYTEQRKSRTGAYFSCWKIQAWVICTAVEEPIGIAIQIDDITTTIQFRHEARALNQALLLTSVRQHEFISNIEEVEREKRDLLRQLLQLQKLESLGAMANGIAHDINNILTPIVGYAELALEVCVDQATSQFIQEIISHSQLAANLVRQIFLYTGEGTTSTESVNLSTIIQDMANLVLAAAAKKASVEYHLAPSLPAITADSVHMRQVIMSLFQNAIEAIEESGRITMTTEFLQPNSLVLVPSVMLEVSDNGCGISPHAIDKIFDPFYSTKFVGRGLGLAVVQSIIKLYNGRIEVESEPNRGTKFRIYFPDADPGVL